MNSLLRRVLGRTGGSLVAAALSCATFAAAEEKTFTFTDTQPATLTDWTHTFSLQQFNPTWGALDDVYLKVTFNLSASGTLCNSARSTANLSLGISSRFSLTLPNSLTPLQVEVNIPTKSYTLGGLSSTPYGPFSAQFTVTKTLTGADMSPFIGTGTGQWTGSTMTCQTFSGTSGSPGACITTLASATVEVDYHDLVTPVPEPSMGGLLLAGLGLSGWWLRRFQKA